MRIPVSGLVAGYRGAVRLLRMAGWVRLLFSRYAVDLVEAGIKKGK